MFAAALAAQWAYVEVINDHYDRIARGQQILLTGAAPFRDFFDPGWLLTIYSSAAVQAVFGHRLLGEILLGTSFIAAGFACAAVLVRAATGSRAPAIVAVILLTIAQPRAYDYDKVFFYAFGLFACWRYAETPTRRAAMALAMTVVVGGLYRYDNGVYVGAAALVTLITMHWDDRALLARRLGVFIAVSLLVAAPAALFVATHGGIFDALRQVMSYARLEGKRTGIFLRPALRFELTTSAAAALVYWLLVLTPVVALIRLLSGALVGPSPTRQHLARGIAAVTLCGLSAVFVLRDPVRARYAAVAVPMMVLGAWMAGASGYKVRAVGRLRAAMVITLTVAVALTMASLSIWVEHLRKYLEPDTGRSVVGMFLYETGARWRWIAGPALDFHWMYGYLDRCTAPEDRVMVVGFQPQVPFHVHRAFAGGMVVFFGLHWTTPADQARIVHRLEQESVPIIITSKQDNLLARWPVVLEYVQREYELAGENSFERGSGRVFSVFVKRRFGRVATRDDQWGLPCFGVAGTRASGE
jgi:hypothetical protein